MRRVLYVLHPDDNVATALVALDAQAEVTAECGSRTVALRTRQPIPFGHKTALAPIRAGEPVVKYGEVIGQATADITRGDHVHVHNVESQRARGDRGAA